ncbi:MAG: phosphofructokinase, partial [Planctomycetota bacterium]
LRRTSTIPYEIEFKVVDLKDVAAKTRTMPDEFIAPSGEDVTEAFIEYLRPLTGELPKPERL